MILKKIHEFSGFNLHSTRLDRVIEACTIKTTNNSVENSRNFLFWGNVETKYFVLICIKNVQKSKKVLSSMSQPI